VTRSWEVHEAAYVLALMDEVVPSELRRATARGLDVGCKSWAYLAAQRQVVPGPWVGVEIDPHRRIGGLQTRASVAQWRLRAARDCRFVAGSVEKVTGTYDVVCWFLPFVALTAHRRWGLSPDTFDPPELAAHVWSLVAPGGVLVVSNQGHEEAAAQREIFVSLGIDAHCLGAVAHEHSPFTNIRPVWVARRVR
jgi:SAM-dependent methyltransferase